MPDLPQPEIVTSSSALDDVCRRLSDAGSFAFDTEFVGEDKFQPELCLIQVATDTWHALIDPLGGVDSSPFWALVADESVRVVVHAGAEDLALCWQHIGKPAANVVDLQVIAGLVGYGYPMSLTRLARLTVGARLHKSQTLTDWRRRPLTREQIVYAVDDVIHLESMCRAIQDRLMSLGRERWAEEECLRACRSAAGPAEREQKLRRLRGTGSLRRRELAIAEALLEERDKLAEEYNRPPRSVLRDHLLVEMARRGWTDIQQIRSLRGLNLKAAAVRRLADAVEKAKQLPQENWPDLPNDDDSVEEEVLLSLVSAVLRDHCAANDLSYALLANKQNLRTLIRSYTRSGEEKLPILLKTGWRRTAVGDLLDRLLSGKASIRVADAPGKPYLKVV